MVEMLINSYHFLYNYNTFLFFFKFTLQILIHYKTLEKIRRVYPLH